MRKRVIFPREGFAMLLLSSFRIRSGVEIRNKLRIKHMDLNLEEDDVAPFP